MSTRWKSFSWTPSAPAEAALSGGGRSSLLDAQALARLRALDPGGKAGLVDRVLATYTQSLNRTLAQLRAARGKDDMQTLRSITHTLKSSSASVGALTLAAQCADVEARVRDGRLQDLDIQLDALDAEASRILAGLDRGAHAS